MEKYSLNRIITIWMLLGVLILAIFTGLYLSKVNSSAEDSSAADVTGCTSNSQCIDGKRCTEITANIWELRADASCSCRSESQCVNGLKCYEITQYIWGLKQDENFCKTSSVPVGGACTPGGVIECISGICCQACNKCSNSSSGSDCSIVCDGKEPPDTNGGGGTTTTGGADGETFACSKDGLWIGGTGLCNVCVTENGNKVGKHAIDQTACCDIVNQSSADSKKANVQTYLSNTSCSGIVVGEIEIKGNSFEEIYNNVIQVGAECFGDLDGADANEGFDVFLEDFSIFAQKWDTYDMKDRTDTFINFAQNFATANCPVKVGTAGAGSFIGDTCKNNDKSSLFITNEDNILCKIEYKCLDKVWRPIPSRTECFGSVNQSTSQDALEIEGECSEEGHIGNVEYKEVSQSSWCKNADKNYEVYICQEIRDGTFAFAPSFDKDICKSAK